MSKHVVLHVVRREHVASSRLRDEATRSSRRIIAFQLELKGEASAQRTETLGKDLKVLKQRAQRCVIRSGGGGPWCGAAGRVSLRFRPLFWDLRTCLMCPDKQRTFVKVKTVV